MSVPAVEPSAVVRGEEALGGQYHNCPCFDFLEMTEQSAKKNIILQLSNSFRMLRVRIGLLTLTQLVKPDKVSLLCCFKGFKIDPIEPHKIIYKCCLLTTVFTITAKAFLQYSNELLCRNQYSF